MNTRSGRASIHTSKSLVGSELSPAKNAASVANHESETRSWSQHYRQKKVHAKKGYAADKPTLADHASMHNAATDFLPGFNLAPANNTPSVKGHQRDAHFWSQQHRNQSRIVPLNPENNSRVGVLVTGELRFKDLSHVKNVVDALNGSDCFVVTYFRCQQTASMLSNHSLLLNETQLAKTLSTGTKLLPGMVQWFLLKRGMAHWHGRLFRSGMYRTIARFRTDVQLPQSFVFTDCVAVCSPTANIVFAQSDAFFYAVPRVFLRVFSSMFDSSRRLYTKPTSSTSGQERYKQILRENNDFKDSCLESSQFSPEPRLYPFNEKRQATMLVVKEEEMGHGRFLLSPLGTPERRNLDKKKQSNDAKAHARLENWKTVYCGCKFGISLPNFEDRSQKGVGWKRLWTHNAHKYQSEPAMAFHLLSHGVACLPLDLRHREGFELFYNRANFNFGRTATDDGNAFSLITNLDEWSEEFTEGSNWDGVFVGKDLWTSGCQAPSNESDTPNGLNIVHGTTTVPNATYDDDGSATNNASNALNTAFAGRNMTTLNNSDNSSFVNSSLVYNTTFLSGN